MATRLALTLDCADARLLASFRKTALGYVDEPPPAPFATRGERLASTAAGARVAWMEEGHRITVQDPEGNDFCVAPGPADPDARRGGTGAEKEKGRG